MTTTRLTDERFFSDCLDTSLPGLSEIPALVKKGDLAAAKHIFADYVRRTLDRERAVGIPDDDDLARETTMKEAERVMAHTFVSCRVPYTFGDVIDWEFNPTYNGYREWPWQLNRHPEWRTLARAYVMTGDEKYAEEWVRQFISWAVQAKVPENASGYATVCWRTIEAGIRMACWVYAIHAFLPSPALTDEAITVFFKSIWEHGWRLSNFSTRNNWLIMEMHGLTRICLFFPFLADAKRWLAFANEKLEGSFGAMVYPDGMQVELSMGYHYVCVRNFEEILLVYRSLGLDAPAFLKEGLLSMYELYPKLAAPDLVCPTMNDGGRISAAAPLTRALEAFPEREDFRYIVTKRKEGHEPPFRSILAEYGGAAILRSSWEPDALWLYMDCSPFGCAHQHEDKLSVQLWAYGHELLTEAGTFDYDSSEMRRYVLSTRGHNTARLDGLDQNRRAGYKWESDDIEKRADVLWELSDARETVEARYDEGYGADKLPLVHTRRVIFLKNEPGLAPMFAVIDRFEAEGEHRYELIWHMPDHPVTLAGRSVTHTCEGGAGLTIAYSTGETSLVRGVKEPEFQGWLPKYGVGDVEHYPIPTLLVRGSFKGSARVVTLLCPFRENAPGVTVEASSDAADTTFTVRFADGRGVVVSE